MILSQFDAWLSSVRRTPVALPPTPAAVQGSANQDSSSVPIPHTLEVGNIRGKTSHNGVESVVRISI